MSVPQLPGANIGAAAYNPAAAASPAPAQQQPAYFGRVHFGAAKDTADLRTKQADDAEQAEGNEAAAGEAKSPAKKAMTKFLLAAILGVAGVFFPPVWAGAGLFGLLGLLDVLKAAKAKSGGEAEAGAEAEGAEEVEAVDTTDADAEGAEEAVEAEDLLADDSEVGLLEELVPEVSGASSPAAAACDTLTLSGESIKLSQVSSLIEDEALSAAVKSPQVAQVINDVLAAQYDNVEAVNPRATNKLIDKAVAEAAVAYIQENPDEFA